MAKSAFKQWFKKQYGKLPNERRRERALRRKRDAEHELSQAQLEYQLEDLRFTWFDTALKGWNAKQFAASSKASRPFDTKEPSVK